MVDGRTFYYIGGETPFREIPGCLLLAGFDQFMLGYEKTESIMLPKEHLRDTFPLAGIIRPAILIDGNVARVVEAEEP